MSGDCHPLSSAQKNTLIVLLSICPYVHIKAFCERRVWKLCKFPHLFAMNYTLLPFFPHFILINYVPLRPKISRTIVGKRK